ncbi:MAG TPA: Uma2 family endonuclease, partial [Leptospiraceae bacterium]|nr:Uma2 family endonuclease [Leptospiraceae bacterium]
LFFMGLAEKKPFYTEQEYLEIDRNSELRNELLDGEIYAMTGASLKHNIISLNIASSLKSLFKQKECKVFMADLRVNVSKGLYTYPDILIVCGNILFTDDHLDTVKNPKCIIEVLSDSTEKYDRGEKFRNYRKIESLEEYILISQNEILAEKYYRKKEDFWEYSVFDGLDKSVNIDSIGIRLSMQEIYAETDLMTASP